VDIDVLIKRIDPPVRTIGGYRCPGNIRELKTFQERAILLSGDNQMEPSLPAEYGCY
jgi:transcriptional regulator with AAA-type ATPase domain